MKFTRSLSGVNDNDIDLRTNNIRRTLLAHYDDSNYSSIYTSLNTQRIFDQRRHHTALYQADKYNNTQYVKRIINQEKVKRKLNEDQLESDKENFHIPQIKNVKIAPVQNAILPKYDHSVIENEHLITHYSDDLLQFFKEKYVENLFIQFLFQNIPPKDPLKNHNIPPNLRSKMVDWLIEVLSSYKCTDQTYFLTVKIMDDYFSTTIKNHEVIDLHLTGVAALFIASKYEEIYSMKLHIVHEKIAHRKLTQMEIKQKEAEILNALDFQITTATLLEIYSLILKKIVLNLSEKHVKYLQRLCLYLSKMVLHDYELVRTYNYFHLAGGLIFVGFKVIEQLDPSFDSELKFKEVIKISELNSDDLIEVASQVLNLAKTFDKLYPTLENLKKFNQFHLEDEE